ncbi:MAG: M3 family metallopeptidase [Pirellulaceae bacterium]|nr:M3 family metallopeptidase [Pirellulaceae bacterium]
MPSENPLLVQSSLPFEAPRFDLVVDAHFRPAFEIAIEQQLAEIQSIADQTDAATFDNTLVAMEKTGGNLRRVQAIFFHLCGANTNDELQNIETDIAPKLAAHSDNILLNAKLFARVQDLWNRRETLGLNEEQQRLLQEQYEQFIRAGAKLNEENKKEIRSINEQLSSLSTEFQNNLLAITKERSVLVDNVAELDGMSTAEIAAAAQAATDRGKEGKFLLAITNTTRQPILTSLKNRELRKRVWEASAYRGLGRNGGLDNRTLILKLARFRAGRAAILGYENHAAFSLENQMAEKPEAAFKMLKDLAPKVLVNAKAEAEKIEAMVRSEGAEFELQPWDWEFYAEKVRQKEYQFDENLIKPYFELDNVLKNGVFHTLKLLYGIEFRERTDLPVYHPDVRTFDVFGEDGKQIGLFYADYFQRDSKRGGAWMDALVSQSRLLNQLPVIVNVMNVPRPAKGEPALLSLDLVTTMFHELGHGVHGLFSSVEYPMLSGTSVPRDFVEFPSTFHEDWAIDPAVLKNYATHYQTGEAIPGELLDKAVRASKFNKGFDTMEYVSAALLDLTWHSLTKDQIPVDVDTFEQQTLTDFGLDYKAIPPRYRTAYFAHIWSGGYSASYYAYLWSEVLAADAFAYMQTRGGLSRSNGQSYRDTILSKGGTREVMQQYIDFRGHEPTVDALLIRRGLKIAR